ncbi:hypothetical protein Pst134EA_032280 [Puccinia striiformis f. sp. tritici]|uniref:uncharacterized protein n=1 Tax=Puccinia striiformis f. sp. tritici TaxID=168172 RepID=UPI00200732BF|nr:uncharacterized protein Pst134EA_032280 [Puccinia striiformis f. sp. tritici]KAH9441790.1 hypothetical protein Pst134EA_032280 [Puccinia striiformis f. sp. tritici]
MIRVQSSDLEQEPVYIYVSKYLTGFRVNRKVLSSSAELKRRGLPPPLSVSSTLISSLSPIKSPPQKNNKPAFHHEQSTHSYIQKPLQERR